MNRDVLRTQLDRRTLLRATTSAGVALSLSSLTAKAQDAAMLPEITIDLSSEPASLAPALAYEVNAWSVIHSIFDAPFEYDDSGVLVMIAAESLTAVDDLTYEIRLREGLTFHDGRPLTAESMVASYRQIVDPETGSSIAGNFATIGSVEATGELTATIVTSVPSPWLPAQIAVWMLCLPPDAGLAAETSQNPIGTGPYQFVEWVRGERIVLAANSKYNDLIKGKPIAERVVFRFVSEASTRVADLQSSTAQIVRSVPPDQVEQVIDSGAQVVEFDLSGVAFVRIATDTPPFDDVRIRQAVNHAVDVDAIRNALLGGAGRRLPNLFVPGGLGYDESLAPYAYDPDRARALLEEAGVSGLTTRLAATTTERSDIVEAVAAYLTEVGIETAVEVQEIATFNGEWADPDAAPLRYSTWRPMFDPFNLLNLVVNEAGFLSRHANPNVQALIDSAAVETDPTARAELYRQLGQVLFNEPAALYLWDLTALYGVASGIEWSPRPDDAIVPTAR